MNSTNATCTLRCMYARVKRWRDRESAPLKGSVVEQSIGEGTPSSLSSSSNSKSVSTRTSERQKKKRRQVEVLKTFMPAWLDHDKTIATLSKRPRRSSTNYAQDKFAEKAEQHYREKRFKVAFKEVQRIVKENQESLDKGTVQPKKGMGIRAIIKAVSEEYLDSPNDIKISRGAITRALHRGDQVSPLKAGQKDIVPHDLTYALATHSTMMQVAGDGEACRARPRRGRID